VLVIAPPVLLLDEPLSNLDPTLRRSTRDELRGMLRRQGVTALFVTHDQEDAFAVADRVAFLSNGTLRQVGTPEALSDTPASRDVADFIGHATLVPAVYDGTNVSVTRGGRTITMPAVAATDARRDVLAVLRPEALTVTAATISDGERVPARTDCWHGRIVSRRFLGGSSAYRVTLDDGLELEVLSDDRGLNEGDRVEVGIARMPVPLVAP
jgi:iron(III) transport system ATP-binding protein